MMGFWRNEPTTPLVEAGFDTETKPVFQTLYNRFIELEKPEIIAAIGEKAADALIRNAMLHDEEIGDNVGIDASGYHGRGVLHHCCTDPDECDQAEGLKNIDVATTRTVKESRWSEANEPPELSKRNSKASRIVAIRTGDPQVDDEALLQGYDKVIRIAGHLFGLHDKDAGVRSYKNSDGTTKESWIRRLRHHRRRFEIRREAARPDRTERPPRVQSLLPVDAEAGADDPEVAECRHRRQGPVSQEDLSLQHPARDRFRLPRAVRSTRKRVRTCGSSRSTSVSASSAAPGAGASASSSASSCGIRHHRRSDVPRALHARPDRGVQGEDADHPPGRHLGGLAPAPAHVPTVGALPRAEERAPEHGTHLPPPASALPDDRQRRNRQAGSASAPTCMRSGCEVARLVEWFRLSVRFGWLGSERRIKRIREIVRRGHRKLQSVRFARNRRGLALPYGPQAHRLGWALTPDVPPPLPPKEDRE